jgi:HAMP domain-containing protein
VTRSRARLVVLIASIAAVAALLLAVAIGLVRGPAVEPLAGVGAALAAIAAALAWAGRDHERRIAELESVTDRVGAGDRDARARELPRDELGRLGGDPTAWRSSCRTRRGARTRRDERERILTHASDGVALIDSQGRVVHVNAAWPRSGARAAAGDRYAIPRFRAVAGLDELLRSARTAAHGGEDWPLGAKRQLVR